MKNYNNLTIVGMVVNDAKHNVLSEVPKNSRASFTVAVDRPYKDSDGNHPTDFLNIVAWGKVAEICAEYVKKGRTILVNGRIQSRSYEDNEVTRWVTEIVAESVNILNYPKKDK